jgi:hypothetical protein
MKSLLYFFAFLFTTTIYSQDSTEIKVETPKIITKLYWGKTYQAEDVQIKFVDVLTDSRCPEDVTCIWAGQVVALVEVYKNKNFLEKKELVFEPGKNTDEKSRTLFSSEEKIIMAISVLPYPKSKDTIKKEDYYLQLEISN